MSESTESVTPSVAAAARPEDCAPARPPAVVVVGMVLGVGVLVGLTLWGRAESTASTAVYAVDIAAGVLGCALMPFLLRRPVAGALAVAVLAALSPAATAPSTVGTLHVARLRPFPVAVGVALAGVLAHSVQGLWRDHGSLSLLWWEVLVVVAHAALLGWGSLWRARVALVASLRERVQRAELDRDRRVAEATAQERNRIAREMHDVLAHRLSLLATYAGAVQYRPDAAPAQLAQAAGVIRDGAHQALTDLREVITLLRADDDSGGADRPQPTLADLPRLADETRASGTAVVLQQEVADPASLPGAAARTVYRVVQEALTNARKHAPGLPVEVTLHGQADATLDIDVVNPLPGPAAVTGAGVPGSGTGLIGLSERVRLAGGTLQYGAGDGAFHLTVRLPWPAAEPPAAEPPAADHAMMES